MPSPARRRAPSPSPARSLIVPRLIPCLIPEPEENHASSPSAAPVRPGPLTLAACSGTDGGGAGGASDAGGGKNFAYTPEGYDGVTISLDKPAERIVADYYSAAALSAYGITPVAVFGYGHDGTPGEHVPADVEVLGQDDALSIEKLAAVRPDVIVAYGNQDGSGWTWWDDKVTKQATAIAPFVPVKLSGSTPDQMFTQYRAVAEALGADPENDEITSQREGFEAARQKIRDVTAAAPDISVLAASFAADVIYTSTTLGICAMLVEDGVQLTGPDKGAESALAELSWETISDLPADVILVHDYSEAYEENPIYQSLPAVQAGQLGTWEDKRSYIYEDYTAWLTELAGVLEKAQDIVP